MFIQYRSCDEKTKNFVKSMYLSVFPAVFSEKNRLKLFASTPTLGTILFIKVDYTIYFPIYQKPSF